MLFTLALCYIGFGVLLFLLTGIFVGSVGYGQGRPAQVFRQFWTSKIGEKAYNILVTTLAVLGILWLGLGAGAYLIYKV